MNRQKLIIISTLILLMYIALSYQEIKGSAQHDIGSIKVERLAGENWNINGNIEMNENYSFYIEGKLFEKSEDLSFEVFVSPSLVKELKKEVGFELTGIISEDSLTLNKSFFNQEALILTKEELLDIIFNCDIFAKDDSINDKDNNINDNEDKLNKDDDNVNDKVNNDNIDNYLDKVLKKVLDFKVYKFIDIHNSKFSRDIGVQYISKINLLEGELEIRLTLVHGEISQIDSVFTGTEAISVNFSLRQSHF